jgi:hypothetical protein
VQPARELQQVYHRSRNDGHRRRYPAREMLDVIRNGALFGEIESLGGIRHRLSSIPRRVGHENDNLEDRPDQTLFMFVACLFDAKCNKRDTMGDV